MQFVFRIPYVEVSPLRFGMAEGEVLSTLGQPTKKLKTRRGEWDLRYNDCSLRLDPQTKQLVEIGFFRNADLLVEGNNPFLNPDSFLDLVEKDGGALEFAGVLFLPSYGITLTGFHDSDPSAQTVTAFVRGRLDHLLHRFSGWKNTN